MRVSFGLIFQKLIYLLIKIYISHFNTSQVHLNFWMGPKPTLGFRIQRHWGMGARVVRGTKCNVYTSLCVDTGNSVRLATIWSPCASPILCFVGNFTRQVVSRGDFFPHIKCRSPNDGVVCWRKFNDQEGDFLGDLLRIGANGHWQGDWFNEEHFGTTEPYEWRVWQ